MIRPSGVTSFFKIISSLIRNHIYFLFFLFLLLIIFSCSPTTRIPGKEVTKEVKDVETKVPVSITGLRVLLDEYGTSGSLSIESSVSLYDNENKIALIKPGNIIESYSNEDLVRLSINDNNFSSRKFIIEPVDEEELIKINGKKIRGKIQISVSANQIDLINIIEVEDYVKGVLPKEMPIGKGEENFEALKALAICIRTYALIKMSEGKLVFDLYGDTRDQVYGGADAEHPLSNKAADDTRNVILSYNDEPALIYYHSTCGGFTESSENVFTKEPLSYLQSVEDGNEANCKISPRFQWKESYTKEKIINRLQSYSLLDDQQYELKDISILNKFESGRINELEIEVTNESGEDKSIIIRGNEIRSIIRTPDNKNILWSTMFDISVDNDSVIIYGYGFGHGVGLCQWGAIALSRKGWNYKDILEHYYPGIIISLN